MIRFHAQSTNPLPRRVSAALLCIEDEQESYKCDRVFIYVCDSSLEISGWGIITFSFNHIVFPSNVSVFLDNSVQRKVVCSAKTS